MTAYLVLASIAVLLGLLIHGRFGPAILFATWAGGYTLLGLWLSREAKIGTADALWFLKLDNLGNELA